MSGDRNLEKDLVLSSYNKHFSSYRESSHKSVSNLDDCSAGAMSATHLKVSDRKTIGGFLKENSDFGPIEISRNSVK